MAILENSQTVLLQDFRDSSVRYLLNTDAGVVSEAHVIDPAAAEDNALQRGGSALAHGRSSTFAIAAGFSWRSTPLENSSCSASGRSRFAGQIPS